MSQCNYLPESGVCDAPRDSVFLPVVKERSCDRAKVEFQVQFLAGGPI